MSLFLVLVLLLPIPVVADGESLIGDWQYRINDGDTLWDVAEKYLSGNELTESLRRYNDVSNPRELPTGTVIKIPLAWIKIGEAYATITETKGTSYRLNAESDQKTLIKLGDHLTAGETLISEADSAVTIQLMDGSTVYLKALSQLVLKKLQYFKNTDMVDTRLELPVGKVESTITPQRGPGSRFEIRSPTIITSVRGTQYRLEVDARSGQSRIMVTEGIVRIRQAEAVAFVDLSAGFGSLAQNNTGITTPERLSAAPELTNFPTEVDSFPATFGFSAINGAKKYQLRIGKKGEELPIHGAEIDSNQYVLNQSGMTSGRYWVKIRAVKENGLSGFDMHREFSINESAISSVSVQAATAMLSKPPIKTLKQVIPTINVASGTQPSGYINLFWRTDRKMGEFRLQLAKNNTFDDLLIDKVGIKTFRYTVEDILEPGEYFWRVAVKQSNQEWGQFSKAGYFNVSP